MSTTVNSIDQAFPAKKGIEKRFKLDIKDDIEMPKLSEVGFDTQNDFGKVLKRYLQQVNDAQFYSDQKIEDLVAGRTENLHEVMIAMNEAETAFEMMMEARNKLSEAYHELVRIQSS
ncbi:MAG: fliE [Chlamydiales bacterium]|jgi:flagellar hook-basal body complex protein FliE|nr:fliE [Chlamydiales bacterium]